MTEIIEHLHYPTPYNYHTMAPAHYSGELKAAFFEEDYLGKPEVKR